MFTKNKNATLMSLLSLLAKPYYRRKSTFVKVIVRIGTFWYTIRGLNSGHPARQRRFYSMPYGIIRCYIRTFCGQKKLQSRRIPAGLKVGVNRVRAGHESLIKNQTINGAKYIGLSFRTPSLLISFCESR